MSEIKIYNMDGKILFARKTLPEETDPRKLVEIGEKSTLTDEDVAVVYGPIMREGLTKAFGEAGAADQINFQKGKLEETARVAGIPVQELIELGQKFLMPHPPARN